MSFLDKITDKFNMSGYARERKIVKQFMGVDLSREDYNAIREQGIDSMHKSYLGQRIASFNNQGFMDEYQKVELTQRVVDYLNKADVTFDIDAPENEEAKNIMRRAIEFKATNPDRENNTRKIINFGEPYDSQNDLVALKEKYKSKFIELQDIPLKVVNNEPNVA